MPDSGGLATAGAFKDFCVLVQLTVYKGTLSCFRFLKVKHTRKKCLILGQATKTLIDTGC